MLNQIKKWTRAPWLIIIPVHLLLLLSFIVGFEAPYYYFIPVLWALMSGFGIAIGYHRMISHCAFKTYKPIRWIITLFGIMAGQGSPIFWTAVHNGLHHKHSDKELDPHTPTKGFWHAYMGWQFTFSKKDFSPRWARHLLREKFMTFVSMHYYKIYWGILGLIFLLSWKFALFAMIPAMVLSMHPENIVNSFCHLPAVGYRRFEEVDDLSRNIWLLGILFWGQGFHHNHHYDDTKYDFGTVWWEFDLCKVFIWMMKKRS